MFDTIWATLMSLLAVQEVYNWICKPLTLPDNLCCTLCFERALHIQYIRVKHWLPISSHTWVACLLKQIADETEAMSVVQHWGCRWRNARDNGTMENRNWPQLPNKRRHCVIIGLFKSPAAWSDSFTFIMKEKADHKTLLIQPLL